MKYLIKGKLYNPIKCGDGGDWYHDTSDSATCGDCGVKYGEYHESGCDIERCPSCHLQLIGCECGQIYVVTTKEEQDKNYIKYMSLKQDKENKLIKELNKKVFEEKTMSPYKYERLYKDIVNTDIYPEREMEETETNLDFLERLYIIKDRPYRTIKKFITLYDNCENYFDFHPEDDMIVDILVSNFVDAEEVQEYIEKHSGNINEIKNYINKSTNQRFYSRGKNGTLRNITEEDVNEAIDQIASHIIKQIEKEQEKESEQE